MKKLVDLIEQKGWSRAWICKKTGLTHPMLSYILMGERKISVKYWEKLVDMTEGLLTYQDLIDYNSREWLKNHPDKKKNKKS